MAQSFDLLPPEKQVAHYREMANDAIRQAQGAFDKTRRLEYLAMAASWHKLATEMENQIRKGVLDEFSKSDGETAVPTRPTHPIPAKTSCQN